jgi:hypothetical protein
MQFVLARSGKVALTIRHGLAYPQGFEFELECLMIGEPDDPEDWMGFEGLPYYSKKWARPDELPDGLFRFGLEFADGSKVTTLRFYEEMHMKRPTHPVLHSLGSSSGGPGRRKARYWVWPLPQQGPVAFVCEWPALGIPLTRHEVDSSAIREASTRATPIWPTQS